MSAPLPTRRIGNTALSVPTLGYGAAALGNLYRTITDRDAREALDIALDAGITYIDTAPHYGFGLSERRVGDALRSHPGAIVSSKVGRLLRPVADTGQLDREERHGFRSPMPFEGVFDYSHDGILRSYEDSLQRLGLSRIDILYVHDIGSVTHGANQRARMAQLMAGGGFQALRRLRESGAIGAIGIGVNEIEICLDLMDRVELDVILLAGRYTLLEQEALNELFPRCLAANTSIVIGGPYNSGILAGARVQAAAHYNYAPAPQAVLDRAQRLQQICDAHGVLLGSAALQFVLAHPVVSSVIPGLANSHEVRETLARANAPIPHSLWAELKAERLIHPEAPVPGSTKERVSA